MKLELPKERTGLLDADWLAESVRVTFFFESIHSTPNLFNRLTGSAPAETVQRPAEGILNEVGPFGLGHLFVHQQGPRTDVLYSAGQSAQAPIDAGALQEFLQQELFHVGPSSVAISAIFELLNRAPDSFAGAVRIAFGPVFVRKARDQSEAIAFILASERLPLEPEDRDIFWQVNRPAAAGSFEGKINRLVKWQTGMRIMQQLSFATGQVVVNASDFPKTVNFVRVELDINTLQNTPNLRFAEIEPVLSEVVAQSNSILLSGN